MPVPHSVSISSRANICRNVCRRIVAAHLLSLSGFRHGSRAIDTAWLARWLIDRGRPGVLRGRIGLDHVNLEAADYRYDFEHLRNVALSELYVRGIHVFRLRRIVQRRIERDPAAHVALRPGVVEE